MTPRYPPHKEILDAFLKFVLKEIASPHHWEESLNLIRDEAKRVQKLSLETHGIFIVLPHCHGNGGWCGSEVLSKHKTIKEALSVRPRFREVFNPYSPGSVINSPRICYSEDPNDAIYTFVTDDPERDCRGEWVLEDGVEDPTATPAAPPSKEDVEAAFRAGQYDERSKTRGVFTTETEPLFARVDNLCDVILSKQGYAPQSKHYVEAKQIKRMIAGLRETMGERR